MLEMTITHLYFKIFMERKTFASRTDINHMNMNSF